MSRADEIPAGLRALAAELDALGGNGPPADGLPELTGTDFRLVSRIGRGGMGEVYSARQVSLDRTVAVKVLPDSLARDPELRRRFLAEARTVARLHHPNIVQTIAAGEANGRLYFAMELAGGETAAERRFADDAELARFGIRVAEALAYAHACGVVHRDVKPSNVFVSAEGRVKLGDFGLACLEAAQVRDRSGTRKYMAPEQKADGTTSAKSDQHAFGAMMLELAAPLRRDADFAAILGKATASDPSRRYASMTEVAEDLERYLRREPVRARPAGAMRRIGLWSRRSPAAAGGAGTAALCLVGLVASLLVGYAKTSRALAETERARQETQAALRQVENEAGRAALSLATTLTAIDRSGGDFRASEIDRALEVAEVLAKRFPGNREIQAALGKLRHAKEAHARFKARRGGGASDTFRRSRRGRPDASVP